MEVQHPWEQQDDDELEEGLVTRRKTHNQTPLSITITADFTNNVTSIGVTNGKHQQENEDEEKVKDFSQEHGIKVDEDEKEKEKQQYQQQEQENEDEDEEKVEDFSHQNGIKADEDETEKDKQQNQQETEEKVKTFSQENGIKVDEDEKEKQQNQQQEEEIEEKVDIFSQENGRKIDEDEKEKEKQETSEYSVYYDTDKGIWKCRICSWDHQGRTCLTRHKRHSHLPVNVITKYEIKGNGLKFESSLVNANGVDSNAHGKTDTSEIQVIKDGDDDDDDETTEYEVETVIKKQNTHDLFCPNCNSCITKRVILRKRKRRIRVTGDDAKRNKPEANVITPSEVNEVLDVEPPTISNEFDHQREEPDVFRCLSCFSIFMHTGNGFKLFRMFGNKNNQEYNEASQKEVAVKKSWFSNFFVSKEVEQLNNQGTVQSLDMENKDSGLSRQDDNSHDTKVTTDLDKKKLQSVMSNVGKDGNVPLSSTQESVALQQQIDKKSDNANGTTDLDEKQVQSAILSVGRDRNVPLSSTQEQQIAKELDDTRSESNVRGRIEENALAEQSNNKSEYPGIFAVSPSQNDGLKFLVPSNAGPLIFENSQTNQGFDVTVQMNNPGLDEKGRISMSFPPLASNNEHSYSAGLINDQGLQYNLAINGKEQKTYKDKDIMPEVTEQHSIQNNVEILRNEPLKVDKDVLTDKQIKLLEDFNNIERIKGKDTIITIESKQPDASAFQRLGEAGSSALPQVQTESQAVQQGRATMATRGGRSLDIIKSIVYGGLIELITSLSVVSSAAGGDAATVNVLALGLANIFGGLFVISHDLWGLKNERTRKTEDRYQLLLGQRTNFPLHMVASLISYLFFGFLPPIVYAFSFRASNDKNLKLLMVAAASIVCILILAAAKAYVQSPRRSYFKTISYYVVFGFMVSGVSYLFGGLIIKLLEKMDIFHSGSVDNLSIHGVSSKPALVATF